MRQSPLHGPAHADSNISILTHNDALLFQSFLSLFLCLSSSSLMSSCTVFASPYFPLGTKSESEWNASAAPPRSKGRYSRLFITSLTSVSSLWQECLLPGLPQGLLRVPVAQAAQAVLPLADLGPAGGEGARSKRVNLSSVHAPKKEMRAHPKLEEKDVEK